LTTINTSSFSYVVTLNTINTLSSSLRSTKKTMDTADSPLEAKRAKPDVPGSQDKLLLSSILLGVASGGYTIVAALEVSTLNNKEISNVSAVPY
jgi:hypothetical protein